MKYSDYEIVRKVKNLKTLAWVQLKQLKDISIKYATHDASLYFKGDIQLDGIVDINYYDKLVNFYVISTTQSDDQITESILFRGIKLNNVYCQQMHKLNECNSVIVKKCLIETLFKEQLLIISQLGNKTQLTVCYQLQLNKQKLIQKYIKECIINYTSLKYMELFPNQNDKEQVQDIYDQYGCNFNDSSDFESHEKDSKYFEEHHRVQMLDSEDAEIYQQLFERVAHLKLCSNTIIRFLIARGFDVEQSYQAIQNWISWRRINQVNRLFSKNYPEFSIFKVIGESKCGRPVAYTKQALLKPNVINQKRYTEYFIAFLEDVCRQCKGLVDSYITIVDVDGYSYSNFDMKMTRELLQLVLQYYPERQHKVFIINTSAIVMGFYRMLKPWLPVRTNDKLVFLGKNRQEIDEKLMEDLGLSIP